ncbi:hypothetical protein CF326_g3375, partial [Tilletia indica]
MTKRTTRSKKTTAPTSPRCARCDAVPSGCQCKKAASSITQRKSKAKAPLPVTLSSPVAARAAAGSSSGALPLPLALDLELRPAPEHAASLPPLGVVPSPSQAETQLAAAVSHHAALGDHDSAVVVVEEPRLEPGTDTVQEASLLSAAPTSDSQRRFLAPLSAPSQAEAEPTVFELSVPSILNNDDADLDGDENEDLDEPENQKDLDGGRLSEKASRILWLSTMDAIGYMGKQPEWKYIFDDRKRARIVREKYWRIVRD